MMKEDYLWDKTGDDAEIKKLENTLAAFRYQETAPPVLEQKVFTLEKSSPRRFFRFAFGFAAFASVVAVLSLLWFQLSGSKTPVVETVSETNVVNRAQKTADDSFVAPRETVETIKAFDETKPFIAPKIVKIRQTIAPVVRRREKITARNKKFTEPVETLTKEEQYAYDQLMLALTITGSKLKIVQDKVNGIEEQNAVVEK